MHDHIYWLDNTQSTLVLKLPEYWTWSEMVEWVATIKELLDNQKQAVTIIVDYQESTFIPQNAIINLHKLLCNQHPKTQSIILTGMRISQQSIWSTMFCVYPHLTKHITIMDDPYQVVR